MWYAPSVRVDTAALERAKSIVRKAVDDCRAASQDGRVSPEVEALFRDCKSGVLHPSYSDPTPEPPKYACRLTDGLRADVQKFYDETFWRVR
jgi:hypothetical protein